MSTAKLYYFAYGSNLHPLRLQQRVPSCQALGIATLDQHQLRWHKRGGDGSGKCDAFFTGEEHDRLIGVVYSLVYEEKILLDQAEGLGNGYYLATATLQVAEQSVDTFFYQAEEAHIDHSLRPYDWYHQLVLQGSRIHDLPDSYVEQHITTVNSLPDTDQVRNVLHQRIISDYAAQTSN